ncbi:MAG: sigma-54-dependent Fis family transcriptional regulator [Chitinophagaceae bacterium]|nr:sigma-54-dependent Fis family transcriptional regulator [Chitinophagaceae bacterium]
MAAAGNILVVDDEDKLRGLLKRIIGLEGYIVHEAIDCKSALKVLGKEEVEVVVCDVRLPDGNGLELTGSIKRGWPDAEIILLTAHANIPDVVRAMRSGAFDYISKGDDNDKLLPLIAHAIEKARLQKRVRRLQEQVQHTFSFDHIIGDSTAIQQTKAMVRKVTAADTTVMLLGETGTGKELFAKAIHAASGRASFPFVALNCSAFSKDLLESELFGHKAGAFTGAMRDKKGLIEEADGGTLFLDEIGEMQLDLQAKLLRVLEVGQFFKVGSTVPTAANVRILSATNRNLEQQIRDGLFREDLFYRLNVFTVEIPPLRDRRKDIPLLAKYFMKVFADKLNKRVTGMSREFLQVLERMPWKGNIRELKNVMERAVILSEGEELGIENLPASWNTESPVLQVLSTFDLASVEKLHIQRVLNYTHGNKVEAARLLNIGLTTVYRKMEEYGLNGPYLNQ